MLSVNQILCKRYLIYSVLASLSHIYQWFIIINWLVLVEFICAAPFVLNKNYHNQHNLPLIFVASFFSSCKQTIKCYFWGSCFLERFTNNKPQPHPNTNIKDLLLLVGWCHWLLSCVIQIKTNKVTSLGYLSNLFFQQIFS